MPHGEPPKAWVLDRGHEMEAVARRLYEGRTGAYVTESGICVSDDEGFAYSSDGLVDDDGLIEIKALVDSVKIAAMWRTGDTSEYDHQMQGGMWITSRKWCDFIMYVPDLAAVGKDLFVKRVYRDDAFIADMVAQLVEFEKLVSENEALWREGTVVTVSAPQDEIAEGVADELSRPVAEGIVEVTFEPVPVAPAVLTLQGKPLPMAWPPLVPAATTLPTLTLGQITERLGFALTADFLRGLGFEPAAREKAARLFHEHDFPMICAALQRHISAVQAKQAA